LDPRLHGLGLDVSRPVDGLGVSDTGISESLDLLASGPDSKLIGVC
jgi:hypothetical protein